MRILISLQIPYGLDDQDVSPKLLFLDTKSKQRLSPSLQNQIHLAVKSFYRFLVGNDEATFDKSTVSNRHKPINSYKPFLEHINNRSSVRKKDRYLHGDLAAVQKRVSKRRLLPENVLRLIKACHLLRDALLVTLLYNTGLRIGEALGLRHVDIDIEEQAIWVVPRQDNENGARCKGNRTRAVPVMPYLINMYEDYMLSEEYAQPFETGTEYVFCNIKNGHVGKALSHSYAQNLNQLLVKRTGIKFYWHMFRHTHASEIIADGHSLLQVADRLGHSSPQTTVDFYKHLFSSEIRKMHLVGPESLQKRIDDFNQSKILNPGATKWL